MSLDCYCAGVGGDILNWALEEETLEDKLAHVSYTGKMKITGTNILSEIVDPEIVESAPEQEA